VSVDDGPLTGSTWRGLASPGTLTAPDTVRIELEEVGPAGGAETVLNVTNGSGIVAANDGGTWAGASDLELPYP
jgi:hypothetical protein